jgi:nucleotide-binding universal stress UspA family protein
MTRGILHPTEFSKASAPAFTKAVEMAKASRAELLIAHVMNPIVPVAGVAAAPCPVLTVRGK